MVYIDVGYDGCHSQCTFLIVEYDICNLVTKGECFLAYL